MTLPYLRHVEPRSSSFLHSATSISTSNPTNSREMSVVQIDAKIFHRRARFLLSQWKVGSTELRSSVVATLDFILALEHTTWLRDFKTGSSMIHRSNNNQLFPDTVEEIESKESMLKTDN